MFSKTAWKWKKLDPRGRQALHLLDSPMIASKDIDAVPIVDASCEQAFSTNVAQ